MFRKSPAGLSEKERMIPDGAESREDEGLDNPGFEGDVSLKKKPKVKKTKKKKRKQSEA